MNTGGRASHGAGAPAIAYEPGLDGLRALALFTILLFHARVTWALGGFISVSLFFTLSGYLITTLVLQEIDRTGRVDLKRFLLRRVRRLAPGSYLALLVVVATATWYEAAENSIKLRGDVFAAAGYVANWRFLFDHQSYADLFKGGPSPVLHFWSLAIEEQFYLFFPLLLAGGAWLGRRLGRRAVAETSLVLVTLVSVVATVLNTDSDAAYYATHLRAPELLAGGVAAIVIRRVGLDRIRSRPTGWWVGGIAGLALYLWLCTVVEQEAIWFDRGGFIPFTLLWTLLIVSVLVAGPMRAAFGVRPLAYIGQLSFSLYLYHWPVYLLLDEERTGLSLWPNLLVRWAVTLALGAASYHFVEQPIRNRRIALATWRGGLAYVSVVALSVGVAAGTLRADGGSSRYDEVLATPDDITVIGDPTSATTLPPAPYVVVVVGSDAEVLDVVRTSAATSGAEVVDLTDAGCSMMEPTRVCLAPSVRYAQYASVNGAPDRVVLASGAADHEAVDRRLAAAEALGPERLGLELDGLDTDIKFVGLLRSAVPADVPIIAVDGSASSSADFTRLLTAAVLRMLNGELVAVDDLLPELFAHADSGADGVPRLMVVGDSTSYGVSLEADRLRPGAFEIVWAGYRNCPMVPLAELRWFEGASWTMEDCVGAQRKWPALIDEFAPDVLLIVLSLPEHSDQRYTGDETWYSSLDPRFVEEHDRAMEALLAALQPYGTQVLVANSPVSYMSPKDRVDAWNGLLEVWDERWPEVTMIDLATPVAAAEAAAGAPLRPDGIHLDDATLAEMVRTVFLPAIDAAALR